MTRLIVSAASAVCSVESTRCPVSAATSAVETVSKSRISPTRITSGSCRSEERSAVAKLSVSKPTSRWLTRLSLSRCRYSIGSSIVMMWQLRVELTWSIIAASEVDLPLPVVPVTRIRPRGSSASRSRIGGSPSSRMVRIFIGITRSTAPIVPRCW